MIVFVECGRLGNQLFQYAALRTLALQERERLTLLGFAALAETFDGIEATVIRRPRILVRGLQRYRERIDALSVATPLLGIVSSLPHAGKRAYLSRRGALGVRYGTRDWFDSGEAFTAESIASLSVKATLIRRAQDELARRDPEGRPRIFVHVRRGDFLHWPSPEFPAVLPAAWYEESMTRMRTLYDNPLFVVVSDDTPYVMEQFGGRDDCFISTGGAAHDFALMTLCDGGILSASTFSWWSALFVARDKPAARFLGPKQWDLHPMASGGEMPSPHHSIEYVPVPGAR